MTHKVMPNLGEGVGGEEEFIYKGIYKKRRHGYGINLTLIEPKLVQKEDRVDPATELFVRAGCDLNRLKENNGPSEIASNIVLTCGRGSALVTGDSRIGRGESLITPSSLCTKVWCRTFK